MPQINVKNPDVHRLAHELARLTGETVTQAIASALAARLEAVRRQQAEARQGVAAQMLELVAEAHLPVLDARPMDGILYDANGLPKA